MGVTPPEPPRETAPPAAPASTPPPAPAVHAHDDRDPFSVLPFDLNGELVVYVLASALVALVVLLSDFAGGSEFILAFTAITFAYLLSRGIAKAGRVWER